MIHTVWGAPQREPLPQCSWRLIDYLADDYGHKHHSIFNIILRDGHVISVYDDQIGLLANLNAAQILILSQLRR